MSCLAVRIKICGLTREQDVDTAVAAGADALGFVFYPQSPRYVTVDRAVKLCHRVPPFTSRVGLFVDAPVAQVNDILSLVPLSLLQFHGNESADYCESFGRPYIKAIRLGRPDNSADKTSLAETIMAEHRLAAGFLLDTYKKGLHGGTGKAFDWTLIPANIDKPVILAGGLALANVADAIQSVNPYAVDVSSGVEEGPGIKDSKLIRQFVQEVRSLEIK